MEKLKTEREKKGWSYQIAAEKVGISKPFYWQIENEKRRLTYELAIRLAKTFGTTPDTLLYDDVVSRMEREGRL